MKSELRFRICAEHGLDHFHRGPVDLLVVRWRGERVVVDDDAGARLLLDPAFKRGSLYLVPVVQQHEAIEFARGESLCDGADVVVDRGRRA